MKLGVSYIVFDGLELLEDSIDNIRDHVDFITLGYSLDSFLGKPSKYNVRKFCNYLLESGKVDDVHYSGEHPYPRGEMVKNNVGLDRVRELTDCTHYMMMPTDEFFIADEFEWAKREIVNSGYDAGAAPQIGYYKNENYRISHDIPVHKPLMFNIANKSRRFVYGAGKGRWPLADPNTKMPSSKLRVFTREEFCFHHMSYVRKDVDDKWRTRKFVGSSQGRSLNVQAYMQAWEPGMKALTHSNQMPEMVDVEVLDDPPIKLKHFYEFDYDRWLI